ncbi:conserved unknown protein [Ectocarpus siliculosus]|uniref:Uncharacterized protein n=1 Tax=Ectocarpus siliculosus TaxID=2880 RepID=D7FNN0_ECTSI|nr:conserved unknown protein [Ectocarpus siliculosus]|eukprot:CBJ26041.1 conserved unknown protein [Ectocarpus siliculosus]
MNITKENFEQSFDVICEAIRSSHFIALDTEFTGLRLPGAAREKMMDSVQARYDLARGSCSQFMLTQYGICCFRYHDERLEARPFNCFVVPSTYHGSDRVYSCQASSMDFLSKHGFDFQAWASHGVPFLSRAEEEVVEGKLRRRWEREATVAAERKEAVAAKAEAEAAAGEGDGGAAAVEGPVHTARDGTTIESLQEPEKGMVKDALKKVEALLAESSSGGEYVQKSVKLEPMNGRQRWLMYEFVGSSTADVKLSNLPGPAYARPMEIRTVCKDDPEKHAEEEAKLRADEQARQLGDLRRAVGFRRVVDEISKAGKPVICHNGLLDLLHTHDKFVGPIPVDMDDGTRALHSLLPRLFDSKVVMAKAMAAGMKLPRTVLGEAHQWLREKYPAPPPPPPPLEEGAEAGMEPAEGAAEEGQQVDGTAVVATTSGGEANGDSKTNGEGAAAAAAGAGAVPPVEAGAEAAASERDVEALERARRGWDAVLAPGFEERYKDGGREHEAGFDAYLTGCCFAAAATVGLGVGLDELKRMASGEETPAALGSAQNVLPLYKVVGGQQVCLPGPAPKVDLSRYVHVSGFPSAARTDAVLASIKAVDGCVDSWFHWMDDTSGVVDCTSAEGAEALLRAAAAAADAGADASAAASGTPAAGDGGSGEEADPCRLSLGDLKLVQMEHALLNGGGRGAPEAEEQEGGEGTARGAKRLRRS